MLVGQVYTCVVYSVLDIVSSKDWVSDMLSQGYTAQMVFLMVWWSGVHRSDGRFVALHAPKLSIFGGLKPPKQLGPTDQHMLPRCFG